MKILREKNNNIQKIGFYSGSFDPIHLGHITFALQALKKAKLDVVYFLPERFGRNKINQEHFGHRVEMIKQAIKPHPRLQLLELSDKQFDVKRTFIKLQKIFSGSKLHFLFGSDILPQMNDWPHFQKLNQESKIIIATRKNDSIKNLKRVIELNNFKNISFIQSLTPNVSSSIIREALYNNQTAEGALSSVLRYINKHWLYVSLR
ncbi:MAG: nicotinate (nicotinamide) nucleotide adenylyltransferase [Patescibacteria group bacterium]|jgi:cytidyltransferase-related domain|nr:nicotinate (nicotinamide) nucleotide adenylyltransferase [Patescibacteria group bacterium]